MSHRSCSSGKSSVESAGLEIVRRLTLSPAGRERGGGRTREVRRESIEEAFFEGGLVFVIPPLSSDLIRSDPSSRFTHSSKPLRFTLSGKPLSLSRGQKTGSKGSFINLHCHLSDASRARSKAIGSGEFESAEI